MVVLFGQNEVPLAASAVAPQAEERPRGNRLVALGDSITRGYGLAEGEGWVEILAREAEGRLGRRIDVINAGGNGNTSREGLRRLAADVLPHLPATVFIEFGGNDTVNDSERYVPLEEYRRNLETLVTEIEAAGGNCVILTFPVVITEQHQTANDPVFLAQGGIDRAVDPYREVARECAARRKIPLLDLDRLTRSWIDQYGSAAIIAPDGIHWTPKSSRLAADAVLEFLITPGGS